MRTRTRVVIMILLLLLVAVISLEIIGQHFVFKDKLYFVNNVDHRMKPTSQPDINSDGIRSLVEANQFHEEDLNIIFLGDSFVYGYRLPHNKSIPYMFESKARALHPEQQINVANFGWTSSSPLLSLRLLKDVGGKYKPDIVMLAIDMTDFCDDIKYSCLLEKRRIYRALDIIPVTILILRKITSREERFHKLHEMLFGFPARPFFVTDKPLSETRAYYAYIQENIDGLNEYSENILGARFMVFVFPRSYQYSDIECPNNWEKSQYQVLGPFAHEPFTYFEQIKDDRDYPIVSLLAEFQNSTVFPTVFDDDPHWNEAGNRIAVDAIYEFCLREKCFD